MRSVTLLELLPPPCAGDPRRTRYAAKLVARLLKEFEALGGVGEEARPASFREWLGAAEPLAVRIGVEPSLAGQLAALRAAVARARAGSAARGPALRPPQATACVPPR